MIAVFTLALAQVPAASTQLVTALATGPNSSHAVLQRWEKQDGTWVAVGQAVPARLGSKGLAWGEGLHPAMTEGTHKREGDGRSPMGIFAFGTAFADHPPPLQGGWPLLQTTVRDLWVEDPNHAAYNTHLRIPDGQAMTEWEVGQRMRLGDEAHQLKLVVNHNTSPAVAGHGSAIFLHIWRAQGTKATSGCTAMPEGELLSILSWLRPDANPVYALLTADEYTARGAAWGLPPWSISHTAKVPRTEP